LDQNCTDFNIKIQFEFIKYESKVSGKKKENISLCSAISAQSSATSPQPTAAGGFQRAPPRPGRNLGLGQEFGRAASPAWAKRGPSRGAVNPDRPTRSDGWPSISLDQNQRTPSLPEP